MLGPLTIRRHDVTLALPASRKVRALLAYLALAPHAVARSQLCELLWDVPNDPRGELRWCLSKIRGLVDEPVGGGSTPRRTPSGSTSRTASSTRSRSPGRPQDIETLAPERLRTLAALFAGDFLDGLEIDRSPAFNGWLTAQRRRFRGCHAALLERLVESVPDDEALGYLEKWLELAPFDRRVHELLLDALARHGRIREGEEHLAATTRLFEAEGLDCAPIRDAWRAARAQGDVRRAPGGRSVVTAASSGRDDDVAVAARRASIAVMPFVDLSAATRRARRGCRRARPRRDHQARQAAQPVRHRAGDRVRPARATHRPGGGRPDAERRLRRRADPCGARANASR